MAGSSGGPLACLAAGSVDDLDDEEVVTALEAIGYEAVGSPDSMRAQLREHVQAEAAAFGDRSGSRSPSPDLDAAVPDNQPVPATPVDLRTPTATPEFCRPRKTVRNPGSIVRKLADMFEDLDDNDFAALDARDTAHEEAQWAAGPSAAGAVGGILDAPELSAPLPRRRHPKRVPLSPRGTPTGRDTALLMGPNPPKIQALPNEPMASPAGEAHAAPLTSGSLRRRTSKRANAGPTGETPARQGPAPRQGDTPAPVRHLPNVPANDAVEVELEDAPAQDFAATEFAAPHGAGAPAGADARCDSHGSEPQGTNSATPYDGPPLPGPPAAAARATGPPAADCHAPRPASDPGAPSSDEEMSDCPRRGRSTSRERAGGSRRSRGHRRRRFIPRGANSGSERANASPRDSRRRGTKTHMAALPLRPSELELLGVSYDDLRALLRANGGASRRNDTTAAMAARLVALLAASGTNLQLPPGVHRSQRAPPAGDGAQLTSGQHAEPPRVSARPPPRSNSGPRVASPRGLPQGQPAPSVPMAPPLDRRPGPSATGAREEAPMARHPDRPTLPDGPAAHTGRRQSSSGHASSAPPASTAGMASLLDRLALQLQAAVNMGTAARAGTLTTADAIALGAAASELLAEVRGATAGLAAAAVLRPAQATPPGPEATTWAGIARAAPGPARPGAVGAPGAVTSPSRPISDWKPQQCIFLAPVTAAQRIAATVKSQFGRELEGFLRRAGLPHGAVDFVDRLSTGVYKVQLHNQMLPRACVALDASPTISLGPLGQWIRKETPPDTISLVFGGVPLAQSVQEVQEELVARNEGRFESPSNAAPLPTLATAVKSITRLNRRPPAGNGGNSPAWVPSTTMRIEVDRVVGECMLAKGHVVLGYRVVALRPYTPTPRRCSRCLMSGHIAPNCRNAPKCRSCGAGHLTSDCTLARGRATSK